MASLSPASPASRPCRWGLLGPGTFGGLQRAREKVPPPPPQKDASLQPPERLEHRLKHSGKRKRGGSSGATGEPGDSSDREPGRPSGDRARKWPNKRRRKECDAESDLDERVSDDDLDPSFTVSTSKASGPHGAFNGNCEAKLSVVPKVSGLERSQEQPPGPDPLLVPFPPKEPPPPPAPRPPVSPPAPLPAAPNLPPPPQPQLQLRVSPFGLRTSPYGSSLDLSTGSFPPPGLRPPPPPHHPSLFSPGPTLPPPPPLLQVPGHPGASAANALSEQDLIGQDLNSRYLNAQGGPEVVGAGGSARPLAFQFHQHNHQHQHTHQHTHQHFTPYPPGLLPPHGPHMPYTAFPPAVPGLPPGLPPAVSFGSLQGAFQPKVSSQPRHHHHLPPLTNPDTPRTMYLLIAPNHAPPPALTLWIQKPGKWCAMHVRVAYMILRHQEKMKSGQPSLGLRVPTCSPRPTLHTLSLIRLSAPGAVHAAANPFTAAPGAHGPFLSPSTHIDPFGRPTSFASLAALSNGAFGGLGSPTFNSGAVFAQKESPGAPPAFASPPDPWGRLHRSPLAFPAWVRPPEAARTPGSDKERPVERREPSLTKEEKDSPPERCAGFLEPTWLAGPPRLARPPRFYEAGEELTGPGAVAAARLYGLEPAHPLLYSRLAPPPPPTAAPGTPHLLSKTPPGALLGAPPPLVPAPRPSSPPRAPGPARADR
ncbi:hypothetical protein E5288_WYG013968 [Bos mutus]|uniref:Fibrosin-1 n=1 Tax=Bos mutus TaxID=72004 RepID=A0A6B0RIA3_9CETA|nr:hypothetical protein [Bos mutus]